MEYLGFITLVTWVRLEILKQVQDDISNDMPSTLGSAGAKSNEHRMAQRASW